MRVSTAGCVALASGPTVNASYANANAAATPLVDSEILEHPGIYPSEEARQNMYVLPAYSAETDRLVNRLWASFLTGN